MEIEIEKTKSYLNYKWEWERNHTCKHTSKYHPRRHRWRKTVKRKNVFETLFTRICFMCCWVHFINIAYMFLKTNFSVFHNFRSSVLCVCCFPFYLHFVFFLLLWELAVYFGNIFRPCFWGESSMSRMQKHYSVIESNASHKGLS